MQGRKRGEERLEVSVRDELVVQLCPSLLNGHHRFGSTWIMHACRNEKKEGERQELEKDNEVNSDNALVSTIQLY